MLFALPFPAIDPVLIAIGPFAIRWYALAYIGSLLLGWRYVRWLSTLPPPVMTREQADDLLVWITLGVILGGRIGYVVFYKPLYYLQHPLEALAVWHGGMSFHGGLIGVLLAGYLFARRNGLHPLRVGDMVAAATPIGLFFGRLANFINGELFGRPSDVPWAMVFPHGGPLPRHPSQLYEAALEGLVLFTILLLCALRPTLRARPGLIGGVFLAGYGLARSTAELFREPDEHLGFLLGGATMGQLLSLPMILLGLFLILRTRAPAAVAR
jgi:phosphatidylglycerol---prolipoprotein diacylglyceryl transferase